MARGGAREGAGRKKIAPENKAKPISKVVYVRLENELYDKLESIAESENQTISQYLKKMIINKIESTK
ncbi:hypothetical protein R4J09_00535 [Brachyspira intermedia]|uniref:hypothetical protein n=1 Tax=Brachyspira intermedia TaxID=84377 RepID=UPI002639B486|nr:hypothetical protein [uncultured Brachyspira sp.]